MTDDSCSRQVGFIIDWMWKSDENSCSYTETDGWNMYTDVESAMIEEAFQEKTDMVSLDTCDIDLKNLMHITSKNNVQICYPVRRTVRQKTERRMMRRIRFLPDAIPPSRSFEQWQNGASHFVFTVRSVFNLEKYFSLNKRESCRFLVEKAAEGLLVEGKLVNQQKAAEWMAKELRKVKDGPKEEVIKVCARLYSMDSFLFRRLNEVMRFDADKEKSDLWHGKLHTFGPFAFLLQEAGENNDTTKTTVYRGATLSDELIEQYKNVDANTCLIFPSFTSTSRNAVVGEIFGGNTIFMIDILPSEDAIDISSYSNMPDEEELLLHAYFEFRVVSCLFDTNNNKWIIHLKSIYVE